MPVNKINKLRVIINCARKNFMFDNYSLFRTIVHVSCSQAPAAIFDRILNRLIAIKFLPGKIIIIAIETVAPSHALSLIIAAPFSVADNAVAAICIII